MMTQRQIGRFAMRARSWLLAVMLVTIPIGQGANAQYCEGTVYGLSSKYDQNKGTGFLAVRKGPSSSSRMIKQLFNGDMVEILDRRGNWYLVADKNVEGWASVRWMRNSCGY
jgi:hypothetical protein